MKTLSVILALLALIVGAVPVTATDVPEPQPMTVYVYENSNGWLPNGDVLATTGLPSAVHRSNLIGVTTGLHNGCNRVLITSPDWNDCISSVYVPGMEPGWHVDFYIDTNYRGALTLQVCYAGHYNIVGSRNDTTSSFRVVSGNC